LIQGLSQASETLLACRQVVRAAQPIRADS
jgi:hypothetical protein